MGLKLARPASVPTKVVPQTLPWLVSRHLPLCLVDLILSLAADFICRFYVDPVPVRGQKGAPYMFDFATEMWKRPAPDARGREEDASLVSVHYNFAGSRVLPSALVCADFGAQYAFRLFHVSGLYTITRLDRISGCQDFVSVKSGAGCSFDELQACSVETRFALLHRQAPFKWTLQVFSKTGDCLWDCTRTRERLGKLYNPIFFFVDENRIAIFDRVYLANGPGRAGSYIVTALVYAVDEDRCSPTYPLAVSDHRFPAWGHIATNHPIYAPRADDFGRNSRVACM